MPTTTNKQRLLTQLFGLKKRYEPAEREARPVLEEFIYSVCREGATRDQFIQDTGEWVAAHYGQLQ